MNDNSALDCESASKCSVFLDAVKAAQSAAFFMGHSEPRTLRAKIQTCSQPSDALNSGDDLQGQALRRTAGALFACCALATSKSRKCNLAKLSPSDRMLDALARSLTRPPLFLTGPCFLLAA